MPEENIRIRHHIVRPEEQEKFIEPSLLAYMGPA